MMTLQQYKNYVYHRVFLSGYETDLISWSLIEKKHYFKVPYQDAMEGILFWIDMKRNYGDMIIDRPFNPEDYE